MKVSASLVALTAALGLLAPAAQAATQTRYTVQANGVVLEISAPRADIVRVRAGKGGLPEDASWAVAQDVRHHQEPLAVTVTDSAGNVVLADKAGGGLALQDAGFRVRKAMPEDEHYFGLGDKTGPLDRRGAAFSLWNTDQFGFGVATAPL